MLDITGTKKKFVILAFAVIWAVLIAYNLQNLIGPEQPRPAEKGTQAPLSKAAGLRSTSVNVQAKGYPGVIKDLFRPNAENYLRPVRSETPTKTQPLQATETLQAESQTRPSDLKVFTGKLRIAGMLKRNQDKIVFAYKENDVIFMRKGDLLEGKFIVSEVSDEFILITSLADNESSKIAILK